MENNRKDLLSAIKNPLSIIALFLLLLEFALAKTMTNTIISDNQRLIFTWFCVSFPIIVFVGFALIVWFKPENLYGPKDYSDEKYFYALMRRAKIDEEVAEVLEPDVTRETPPRDSNNMESNETRSSAIFRIGQSELLALSEIEKEFKVKIKHTNRARSSFYDGEFVMGHNKYRVEIKYLSQNKWSTRTIDGLHRFLSLSNDGANNIVAIVSDSPLSEDNKQSLESHFLSSPSPVLFRYYVLSDLYGGNAE